MIYHKIGFYEWLTNRKYGVLELFKIYSSNYIMRRNKQGFLYFREPAEILKILAGNVK